jgi:hypothetical protein
MVDPSPATKLDDDCCRRERRQLRMARLATKLLSDDGDGLLLRRLRFIL